MSRLASQPVLLRVAIRLATATAIAMAFVAAAAARSESPASWSFAVSGDSRNCGNLVMPAIADAIHRRGEAFYWHLGDLRRIRGIDEDYVRERRFAQARPSYDEYLQDAWPDFLAHQVRAFGDTPFFLGIGNHETIPPKTRAEFETHFNVLLDRPETHAQRDKDRTRLAAGAGTGATTYYHWIRDGVDFVNLDNATGDRFDERQLRWFEAVVTAAVADRQVRTLVVGMHEALPHSLSDNHGMCSSAEGILSGERVYRALVDAHRHDKYVYVLASHSHYYLENIYATSYWQDPRHGGVVLPGWIVGTAGAARYPLPAEVQPASGARTHVYGYLQGKVAPDGRIDFEFHELAESDLQRALPPDYVPADAAFCFAENPRLDEMKRSSPAPTCVAGGEDH